MFHVYAYTAGSWPLQVGACIVNKDNKIVGTGYNDFPAICADKVPPWKDTSSNDDECNSKTYYGKY